MVLLQAANAQRGQHGRDLGPDVAQMVGGREGQLGAAGLRAVAGIARPVGLGRGRGALAALELVAATGGAQLDPHIVEEKKAEVDADEGAVGDAGAGEPGLGAGRRRARIPLVAHAGGGLGRVAQDHERRLGAEGIGEGGSEIGPEQEVRLADVAPAGHRRAVDHEAVLEPALVHRLGLERRPPPPPDQVGEAEVDDPDAFPLDPLTDRARFRHAPRTPRNPPPPRRAAGL